MFENLDLSSNPIPLIFVISLMSLMPILLFGLTSYVKLSVVFNILRSAIGAPQVPSTAIISLLSIVLSAHIMSPVFTQTKETVIQSWNHSNPNPTPNEQTKTAYSISSFSSLWSVVIKGLDPWLKFLARNSDQRERLFFIDTGKNQQSVDESVKNELVENCKLRQQNTATAETCLYEGESIFSLMPAFVLSELKKAFVIGFQIFLPFVVIDLVVSNVLVALGMNMLSPSSISIPLKILLFVGCDVWFLLCKGLVLSYR